MKASAHISKLDLDWKGGSSSDLSKSVLMILDTRSLSLPAGTLGANNVFMRVSKSRLSFNNWAMCVASWSIANGGRSTGYLTDAPLPCRFCTCGSGYCCFQKPVANGVCAAPTIQPATTTTRTAYNDNKNNDGVDTLLGWGLMNP